MGHMEATAEAMTAHSGGFFASSSLPRTFVDPAKCLPDMRKTKGSAGGHLDYVLPLQPAGNICSKNG